MYIHGVLKENMIQSHNEDYTSIRAFLCMIYFQQNFKVHLVFEVFIITFLETSLTVSVHLSSYPKR